MKTSILVIAHNEEASIGACLESLVGQTKKPDEIVLVAHNSTDKTALVAAGYPGVNVIEYEGPKGAAYARVRGLEEVSGDVILCIDGDAVARPNWVEVMSATLSHGNVMVGSYVKLTGTGFDAVMTHWHRLVCVIDRPSYWLWGSSFAFWGKDRDIVRDMLAKTPELSKRLGLTRNPDDYWLGLFMERRGRIRITNKTFITAKAKEKSSEGSFKRHFENVGNGRKMRYFFKCFPQAWV